MEKTRDDLFDIGDTSDKTWWERLFSLTPEGIEDVSYIEPVTYSATKEDGFSDDYLIVESDVEALSDYCHAAEISGETVYLLRYALADNYRYVKMPYDVTEMEDNGEAQIRSDAMIYWVQENVYLDFDIIQLAFGNDPENLTVFGVVASPTDGFAAIQVTGSGKKTEEKFDWQALFRKILAIVMIFVAVLVIVWLIGKLGEIGQAKTNREIRKYLKNQNKNQNRRK